MLMKRHPIPFTLYLFQPYNAPNLSARRPTMTEENAVVQGPIFSEEITAPEKLARLEFIEAEGHLMVKYLNQDLDQYQHLRTISLENSVSPALHFKPIVPAAAPAPIEARMPINLSPIPELPTPTNLEELAFYPVTHLAHLLKTRQITSVALT